MKNFDNEMRIFSLIFSVFIIELVSFYFNISGGPTAVMSAIVVSQSFVGAQYLKARNRIIGTILGIMASFISAYLYVGNELYFIVFSMLWISFMSVMISLVPTGFAPIFPDTFYHLTHYWPAAADIPVASDNPAHYADAIRYNARTPLQGSLLPLTRLVWA